MTLNETGETEKSSEANRYRGEAHSDPHTLERFLKQPTGEDRRRAGWGAADVRGWVGGQDGVHEGSRRLCDKQNDQIMIKYHLRQPLVPDDQKPF